MSKEVEAALIGFMGGILASVVTVILTRLFSVKDKRKDEAALVEAKRIEDAMQFRKDLIERIAQLERQEVEREEKCHKRIEALETQVDQLKELCLKQEMEIAQLKQRPEQLAS